MSHVVSCEFCQASLQQLAEPLAGFAPALVQLAAMLNSSALQDRLDGLKLQRPSPQPRHPAQHEDLRPWIDEGETPLGRVDQYDLIRCLGRGGMGVVFEAFDRELQRTVAIKLMSPALLVDATYSERVLREARAVAAVDCPSVVKIFAVSKIRDLPYLVMEFVEGESLQQRLDRLPALGMKSVIQIASNLAEGLAAAHDVGVIHRDIKPANVLIRAETGEATITDFGLALRASQYPITRTGVLIGTPEYLAPEQVDGKTVDHRSDLFSLGSLLYQLCAGTPPFSETTLVATLKAVTTNKPVELAKRVPSVPGWFSELVSRMHEKNPCDRIQTATEVVEILEHRNVCIES
ncbi:MAG: serine/threonine-protein kinase [Planctomycetota bacterium]